MDEYTFAWREGNRAMPLSKHSNLGLRALIPEAKQCTAPILAMDILLGNQAVNIDRTCT